MKQQIIYKNIKDLRPYKNNAKKHNKQQIEQIAESIKQFGFQGVVLIDKQNTVVAGHGRILGAKQAGLKVVPTICCENMTEEQIKAYRLVDNKLNESEWDFNLLDAELEQLFADIDMSLFGFDAEMSDEEEKKKKVEFEIKERYEVHIICKDEKQMEQVYNKTKGLGVECKLVSTL